MARRGDCDGCDADADLNDRGLCEGCAEAEDAFQSTLGPEDVAEPTDYE